MLSRRRFFQLAWLAGVVLASTVATAADDASSPVRELVYRTTPQAELKLYVHLPPGWQATDKRPVIVFFFGGGWNGGRITQFETQAKYLASRGLVAARADYRVKSRHNVEPDECVRDAQSAIRYLRSHAKELGVDPNKIIASGGSAGGHLAACCGMVPPLKCDDADPSISSAANLFVLFNPVMNLAALPSLKDRLGGDIKRAEAISPTLHVSKDTPPALLLFGTADDLIEQGKEYVAAAAKVGAKAELIAAEGEKHGYFNRSPWTERTLLAVDKFLVTNAYLTGDATIKEE